LAPYLVTCGGNSVPVASFVSNIERDEINARVEHVGERIELEGRLSEKLAETRAKTEYRSQHGGEFTEGRGVEEIVVVGIITEVVGSRTYSVRCEFDRFGAKQLHPIGIGTRVTVYGELRSWRKSGSAVIPRLEHCLIWPADS
jgi:hypothetical protein